MVRSEKNFKKCWITEFTNYRAGVYIAFGKDRHLALWGYRSPHRLKPYYGNAYIGQTEYSINNRLWNDRLRKPWYCEDGFNHEHTDQAPYKGRGTGYIAFVSSEFDENQSKEAKVTKWLEFFMTMRAYSFDRYSIDTKSVNYPEPKYEVAKAWPYKRLEEYMDNIILLTGVFGYSLFEEVNFGDSSTLTWYMPVMNDGKTIGYATGHETKNGKFCLHFGSIIRKRDTVTNDVKSLSYKKIESCCVLNDDNDMYIHDVQGYERSMGEVLRCDIEFENADEAASFVAGEKRTKADWKYRFKDSSLFPEISMEDYHNGATISVSLDELKTKKIQG